MNEIRNSSNEEELQSLRYEMKIVCVVEGLNKSLPAIPLGEQTRAERRQQLMVLLGNIGVLSAGMSLGLPTVTMRQLTDPNEPIHLTMDQASWFASINTLSCPLGGLLSGLLLDKFGRKNMLYVLNILQLVAWILMAFGIQNHVDVVFFQLLISRFISGVATGLSSAPVGVYSAEISLPKLRGRLILGSSISIAAGILLIYIMGYFIRDDWRLIALISCGYQLVSLFCVMPLPETPSWLISKGRFDEAKKALRYFRGIGRSDINENNEINIEFNVMQKSIQLGVGERKMPFLKSIRQPEVFKPLGILLGLFAFQQLTGIFVVIVYAVQISAESGSTIDPFMCAVLIGLGRVLTTCPLGIILEKWGRRRAGIISTFGMFVCMFFLAFTGWSQWLRNVPYLPVISIVAFIVLSTLGLYTLPFLMISELFPQKVRGPASGFTVAVGMFIAFLCIKTYPKMKDTIGNQLCFVFYGIMSFVAMIFIYFVLPETRGRTLLEIEDGFRNSKKSRIPLNYVEEREVCL